MAGAADPRQVDPDGIDLTVLTDMGGGERHWRTVEAVRRERRELRTMIRYADEQGLIADQFDPAKTSVRADENLL